MFSDVSQPVRMIQRPWGRSKWLEENQDKYAWIIYDSGENNSLDDEEYKSSLNDPRIRSWRESAISDVAWATLAHNMNG